MEKGRPLLQWAGFLLVFAAVSFICIEAQGEKEAVKAPETRRPDLITIATLAAYEKLELPPVTFLHDKHTDALLKEKKGCDTCHFVEDNRLSLAFKRKKGTNPAESKDIYHANCIGCHQETLAAGKKSGPLDGFCRDCHNAKPQILAARLDAGLDKVQHFRHVDAKDIPPPSGEKDNCGVCHHEYDQQAKKIFYAKGKETTCRYCHGDKPQDGVKSLEVAAHLQCVECHRDLANKGRKEEVPINCDGCHGAVAQAKVAKKNQEFVAKLKGQEVPRLNRGQPDVVLITYGPKGENGKPGEPSLMNPVPFDHQVHEKYSDSCRICHHASMESCGKCHTLLGAKEGKFVTFEQSMHLKSSKYSCLGCHAEKQAAANCAGCHNLVVETGRPSDASCRQCHMPLPEGTLLSNVAKLATPEKAGIAASLLKSWNMTPGTYQEKDIPDKVVIKELADKYEPVEMTHRKQVLALIKGMKDSLLASYFHSDPGTMCQGCHHHSPPSKNPPGCDSCHAKPHGKARFDPREADRPGLLAAMHGQCMSCHKYMAVKPVATACTECHKEKQKQTALGRK
jgi:hypothetical protein